MMKIITLTFSLLFAFVGCEKSVEITPSSKTVKVGVLAPLSGSHKTLGVPGLIGMKAAMKMGKYIQNGDEIVLKIVDTKSTLEGSKKALKELKDAEVVAIFSFMGSGRTLALRNEFKKAKIPIIATLSTDNDVVSSDGYVSQVCMDNQTQVIVASHYVRDDRLVENMGVIYSADSQYYSLLAREFKEYFTKIGGKVDFFIDVSVPSGLAEFKNLKNGDTRMLVSSIKSEIAPQILKIIKKRKFNFKVLGANGSLSDTRGFYLIEHYADDVVKSANREKLESILKKKELKNKGYAFLSYDGYQLLKYALENCEDYSSECINPIIKNSDVIQGVSGNFSMIDAKANREIYINRIEKSGLMKEVVIY